MSVEWSYTYNKNSAKAYACDLIMSTPGQTIINNHQDVQKYKDSMTFEDWWNPGHFEWSHLWELNKQEAAHIDIWYPDYLIHCREDSITPLNKMVFEVHSLYGDSSRDELNLTYYAGKTPYDKSIVYCPYIPITLSDKK